jgi:hypothetical protein
MPSARKPSSFEIRIFMWVPVWTPIVEGPPLTDGTKHREIPVARGT